MFMGTLLADFADRIEYGDGKKYYLYEEVWSDYAKDLLSSVFMYAAIALAVILLGIGIFLKLKRPQYISGFIKIAATIALTFAVTVIVTMVALGFAKISEKGYLQEKQMLLVLIPPVILAAAVVLGAIAAYIAGTFGKKPLKIAKLVSLSIAGAALVATVICLIIYYSKAIAGDGYYNGYVTDWETGEHLENKVNQLALYLSAAAFIAVPIAIAFIFDKSKQPFDSKCIALAGICVALSFALSYIRFVKMPQGGSLTLASLLPVMLFAYVYGMKKGLFVGGVYGILQAIQDPYIIHPAQFLLDYPIAFAMVGFTGVFAGVKAIKLPQIKFALGAVLAGVLRFAAHTVSGVFAFSAYAIDSGATNFWVYSLAYNSFVFADVAIVIVVGIILFSSKSFNSLIAARMSKKTTGAEPTSKAQS